MVCVVSPPRKMFEFPIETRKALVSVVLICSFYDTDECEYDFGLGGDASHDCIKLDLSNVLLPDIAE